MFDKHTGEDSFEEEKEDEEGMSGSERILANLSSSSPSGSNLNQGIKSQGGYSPEPEHLLLLQ